MRMTHKMTRSRNGITSAKPGNQAVSIPVCCKHFFPISEKILTHSLVTIGAETQIDYIGAHNLKTGNSIDISGVDVGTPDINGTHTITVVDSNSITIPVDTSASLDAYANGISTPNTINDVAGNVVITDVGKFVWDATLGSAQRTQLGATVLASGTWENINSKDFIMLGVGTTVDDGAVANIHALSIGRTGSTPQNGIVVSHTETSVRGDDDVIVKTSVLDTTLVDELSVSMANISDRNGNLTYRVKGDSDQSKSVSMTTVTGFTPDAYFDSLGMKLQGLALFVFKDGLPSDYETAIDWMYANWTGTANGSERKIYPPWMSLV